MGQKADLRSRLASLIEILLLAAIAFLPIYRNLAETAIVTTLFLWIFKKLWFREPLEVSNFLIVSYMIFLAITALSIIQVPPEPYTIGLQGFFKWLKYILIFMMCADLGARPNFIKKLILVFSASMALVALNGLYQFWTGTGFLTRQPLEPGRIKRIKSTFVGANGLAAFLLMAIPLAYALFREFKENNLKYSLALANVILLSAVFVLTFSRSAFYAIGGALAIQSLVTRKLKFVLVGFVFAAILVFSYKPLFYNFIASVFTAGDITINERLRYWGVTWEMIKAHPFLGNGVYTYFYKFSRFAPPEFAHYTGHAHNSYLEMWSEIGLFGLIAFSAPLIRLFKVCQNTVKNEVSHYKSEIQIGLIAFLIQGFFDTNLHALQTATLFWIFWGILAVSQSR